jgi:signal transduction histidine kinase
LRLEVEQAAATADAELANKLRLALWRLDSRLFTDLTTDLTGDLGRKYEVRKPLIDLDLPETKTASYGLWVVELIPLPGADPPSWMRRHFLAAAARTWRNMPVTPPTMASGVNDVTVGAVPRKLSTADDLVIRGLADRRALARVLSRIYGDGHASPVYWSPPPSKENAAQSADRDTALRFNQAQVARNQQGPTNGPAFGFDKQKGWRQVAAIVGPLVPVWLGNPNRGSLVVIRRFEWDNDAAYMVAVVDWPRLQIELAEEVRDLLPDVVFRPVADGPIPSSDRALAALPVKVEVKVPPTPAGFVGWTALRIGLALTWVAALAALAAVGLGGWSLVEIAERRMRFVSAVTHELRTPLTTLRLYLDMLAGGMVRDEAQRAEYLQTLNAEADRLNRLVGNVLDFSRLENQRARVQRAPIAVADLLGDVRTAWQGHCQQAQKELIVENQVAGDTAVVTDRHLVHQILSNLIDNACKYSREADDRRIWLRAKNSGRQLVFEVEDRGKGVPAGEYRSIFRAFRRGRRDDGTTGGVGLGLALARRWAQDIGGRLTLASSANTGACFRLELPSSETIGSQRTAY